MTVNESTGQTNNFNLMMELEEKSGDQQSPHNVS